MDRTRGIKGFRTFEPANEIPPSSIVVMVSPPNLNLRVWWELVISTQKISDYAVANNLKSGFSQAISPSCCRTAMNMVLIN